MNTIPSSLSKEEILEKNIVREMGFGNIGLASIDEVKKSHDWRIAIESMEEYAAQQLQPPGTSDAGTEDEILGILYNNKSDEADDGSWIDSRDFHKVAKAIALFLKTKQ